MEQYLRVRVSVYIQVALTNSIDRDWTLLLPTSLVICENHFSCPLTVSIFPEGFFLQISGSPRFNSRRWRQSSYVQPIWLWPEHSSTWQYGQATRISYCNPRKYRRSCDKVCKVTSTNSRTCTATSLVSSSEIFWRWVFCLTKNLMNCLLQIKTKSQIIFLPMTNHAPFWYRVGGWAGPASEHHLTSRETSRVNRPWGTEPVTK